MERNRTYYKFLDMFQKLGCLICHFILEDSRGYLDSLMYERILDVPTRLELMDSFGFCSWHAWQIPSLPAISSPAAGYAILASDLLRKFDLVTHARLERTRRNRLWKLPFRKLSHSLFSLMKSKPCPVCVRVTQTESYYFKDLLEFIRDEPFLSAYRASDGICLPHFFRMEQSLSDHPNFPTLVGLQLSKIQTSRAVLEEYIRKQDHRFRDQITSDEAKAWRVAMERLAGKPGVFHNEMAHSIPTSRTEKLSDAISLGHLSYDRVTVRELIGEARSVKEITFYLKQPLSPALFKDLKELMSCDSHPTIEVVVEDFQDIQHLRSLHAAGVSLFYGLGLPPRSIVFIKRNRGFLLSDHELSAKQNLTPIKNSEDLYLRLLWRRFGHAVLLSGTIKEKDTHSGLFCLAVDGRRELWCRLKDATTTGVPDTGAMVEVFGWEKWLTHVLEILELKELEASKAIPE